MTLWENRFLWDWWAWWSRRPDRRQVEWRGNLSWSPQQPWVWMKPGSAPLGKVMDKLLSRQLKTLHFHSSLWSAHFYLLSHFNCCDKKDTFPGVSSKVCQVYIPMQNFRDIKGQSRFWLQKSLLASYYSLESILYYVLNSRNYQGHS